MNLVQAEISRPAAWVGSLLLMLPIAGCGGSPTVSSAPSAVPPTPMPTIALPSAAPTATGVPSQIGIPVVLQGQWPGNIIFTDSVTVTVTAAAIGDQAECLVDTVGRPDHFTGVFAGPWTHESGCWIDSALQDSQTLLAVHALVDSAKARVTDYIAINEPTVSDITGAGTAYKIGAYGQFNNPVGITWLFVVPKLSLFSGVYFIRLGTGDIINLGAAGSTP